MGKRSDIKPLPSLERLNELFVYEPLTGDLRWKSVPPKFQRAKIDDLVGTIGEKGYRVVGVDRVYYLAHRIIWKMMTGDDPADQVDHEDTNRQNNRWSNLRDASNGPNVQNSRLRKDNNSGFKGVCWDSTHNAWLASIGLNGKQRKLGRFKIKGDAIAARLKAAEELHGQFMRVA